MRNVLETTERDVARTNNNLEKVAVVCVTKNYGNEAIYPANDASRTFARIAGTKTLTREVIRLIKQLGYRIDVVAAQPEL